jgi:hypothetical protein
MKGFQLKAVIVGSALALVAFAAPAMASAKDVNRDRIPDKWEKANKLSLKVDQRKKDQDTDGLRNRGEFLAGTNPRDADTDNDGVTDVEENAGAISAWDSSTGQLTVELYAGGTISGTVTDRTRVECEVADDGDDTPPPVDPAPASSQRDRHGDDDGDEGEHHHGDHHGDEGDLCSVDDLAVGVVVHEAAVEFDSTGATFRKIEIVPPATDPAA